MKTKLVLSVLIALCIMASAIMPVDAGVSVGGGKDKDTAKRTTSGDTADNLASQDEVEDIFNYALGDSATITVVQEWDDSSSLQTRAWWADEITDLDPDDMPDWLQRLGDAEDEFEEGALEDDVFSPFTDSARLMWAIETISEKRNINVPYVLVIADTTWNDVEAVIACDGDEDEKPDCYVLLSWESETGKFSLGAKGETVTSVLGVAQQYKSGDD